MFGAIRLAVYRGGAAVPHLVLRRIGGRAVRVGCLYGSRAVPVRPFVNGLSCLGVCGILSLFIMVWPVQGALLASDRGHTGKDPDVCGAHLYLGQRAGPYGR